MHYESLTPLGTSWFGANQKELTLAALFRRVHWLISHRQKNNSRLAIIVVISLRSCAGSAGAAPHRRRRRRRYACMHKRKTKRSSIGSQRGGLIKTKDWRLTQSFWFRRDVWLCFSVIKKNCCCCFSSNSSPSSFFRHPALFLVSFIKVAGCRRVAREKVSVLVCARICICVCVCVTAREKGKKRAFRFESPLKLNCRSFENKKKQFRHFSILVLALVLATGIFNLLTS